MIMIPPAGLENEWDGIAFGSSQGEIDNGILIS